VELDHIGLELPIHALIGIKPLAQHRIKDRSNARKNQADIVLGPFHQELGRFLIKMVRLHPAKDRRAAHGGHDNAVLDFDIADLPRRKQRFVFAIHTGYLALNSITL
jgi:hypothetical protein